ncbi:hypothetical protein F3Y22_tig00109936pilonHSYRG00054 [Hibiscus syriacus]|uniref:Gnk2-homologous domain-containing protein n=1 Tax=Hibiscus syriacus TaxID=106335 RepID=A0A6A3BT12_HIBSY|nr:hypothetical protein F3Y22_tig00109936pilonHSYRG00054 [Hibiscus syriacus]
MALVTRKASFLPFILLIFRVINPTNSATDTFVYGGCSQLKFISGSPYEYNVNSILTSLVNSAMFTSYNNFTAPGSGSASQDTVYGAEDKTVLVRRCGPFILTSSDVLARRDAVLGYLGASDGTYKPFRIGGSGDVQGVAQSVGDLSPSECQDCLSEAIGRLKTDCAAAKWGDMYLAKCYARYSEGGYHSHGGNGKQCRHPSDGGSSSFIVGRKSPCLPGDLIGRHALRATYPCSNRENERVAWHMHVPTHRSPCPPGDLVGRHALRATYPRSAALGFPCIARSVTLGCPRIARSNGLGCSRMASVGWPRMPSVLGRVWHMQSLVARREDMAT